jgi:phosphatidylglycerophosphatase A
MGLGGALIPMAAFAQSAFDGGGIYEGLGYAEEISGIAKGDIRQTILLMLYAVLSYLALLAVIMIIAAGIYLILGFGNEEVKERVKRVLIYTVVGLLIVMVARLIVAFILYGVLGAFTI